MTEEIRLDRVIDLSRSIVWDAFVDPVLVEGWLDPEARLVDESGLAERCDPEPGSLAVIETSHPRLGRVRLELSEQPGGTRGAVALLRLIVIERARLQSAAEATARWQTRLDQLEELLRGHPVDWTQWERHYGAAYEAYLRRADTLTV